MKSRYVGMFMVAALLLAVGYGIGQTPAPRPAPAPQGGEKVKAGRYQVIGAGLITAVMVDVETGKTWALTSPGMDFRGPGMMGVGSEFAWTPITKFDDLDSYRRWVKQQVENRWNMERDRFKDKDKDFREKDFGKDKDPKDKA